jgi:hypothetical protein
MTDDKLDEKEFARRKLEHAIATRRAYAERGLYLVDDIRDLDKIPTGQRLVHDRPPSHARRRKATGGFTMWLEADTPRPAGTVRLRMGRAAALDSPTSGPDDKTTPGARPTRREPECESRSASKVTRTRHCEIRSASSRSATTAATTITNVSTSCATAGRRCGTTTPIPTSRPSTKPPNAIPPASR